MIKKLLNLFQNKNEEKIVNEVPVVEKKEKLNPYDPEVQVMQWGLENHYIGDKRIDVYLEELFEKVEAENPDGVLIFTAEDNAIIKKFDQIADFRSKLWQKCNRQVQKYQNYLNHKKMDEEWVAADKERQRKERIKRDKIIRQYS